eukprot:m.898868 g.898868  ORF g.898868 m.898868 type:complete len:52 (+) comp23676_c0_seq2:237-392(+)
MPERTTQDYFRPDVDPHLSAALEDALKVRVLASQILRPQRGWCAVRVIGAL